MIYPYIMNSWGTKMALGFDLVKNQRRLMLKVAQALLGVYSTTDILIGAYCDLSTTKTLEYDYDYSLKNIYFVVCRSYSVRT